MFVKPRRHIKFLIKVNYDEGAAVLSKVSPILNQLSIDESSNLDDLLFSFFTECYDLNLETKKLTAMIYFSMWKNRSLYNHIKIKPALFYEYMFKYDPKARERLDVVPPNRGLFKVSWNRDRDLVSFRGNNLTLGILESSFWTAVGGYQFFFDKFGPAYHFISGIKLSYLYRDQMLGRKTNFRRKIRGRKFDEY